MDEEDGRLGPPPGHIIDVGSCPPRYGPRQRAGAHDPGELRTLIDVTGSRARQTGRVDVLRDALMMSLCSLLKHFRCDVQVSIPRHWPNFRTSKDPIQFEVMP